MHHKRVLQSGLHGSNRKFLVLFRYGVFFGNMKGRRHQKKRAPAVLLYADTDTSSDMLYFAGFAAPDPFIALGLGRRKIAVLNALEYGRGLKESSFSEVLALEEWQERAARLFGVKSGGPAVVIAAVLRHYKVRKVRVPADFPAGVAFRLMQLGVNVAPADGQLFPQREIKSEKEARAIAAGNRASARGLAAAEDLLRRARVKRNQLLVDGRPLTSERVREEIGIACLRAGAIAVDTIVAGGDQACDPHCRGSGILRPHQLIIVDVFPRVSATGYFGDMTRTFLKGTPNDAQTQLVTAVRSGQKVALRAIRAGVAGRAVHHQVVEHFESRGYATRREKQGAVGFFHGTGHGLGLSVHEPPRISEASGRLREGAVVTVEPGLYYPGLGGCRIEDVVQVTTARPRMLSRFHNNWIL